MVQSAFLKEMPSLIDSLREAVSADAPGDAGRQAHSIKGASTNVGAEALRELAYQVEQAGEAGDLEPIRDVMKDIEGQFELVRQAMLTTR